MSRQRRVGQVQQAAAGGIQNAEPRVAANHEQPGREALDNLAAEPLGRFGARRHLALLRFQLRQRILQRRRDERAFSVCSR